MEYKSSISGVSLFFDLKKEAQGKIMTKIMVFIYIN